jgi:uncharacterized protein YecE (DUF72 family)
LTKWLIGAGGWAYFQVPGLDPLSAYSKAFDFVEVNSTFYELPNRREVAVWRKKVPPAFEFSVRCHRSLTHELKLQPVNRSYEIFGEMKTICRALRADILHIQTPPRLELSEPKVNSIRDFFNSLDLKGIRIAWEVRQAKGCSLPPNLLDLMQDFNIIHCVDLSREEPAYKSDILYTRLFGKGKQNIYEFTDEELMGIEKKAAKVTHRKVVLTFHGLRMYKDAARFKKYRQTDEFPPVTKSLGLDSLKEVLSEDAKFPSTKQALIEHQGWKVIDLTKSNRVHAADILQKLPDQTYHNIDEITQALKQTAKEHKR